MRFGQFGWKEMGMADQDQEEFLSSRNTLSRLVRLETKVCLKFEEMEKALVIAREAVGKEMEKATASLNTRLEGMNEFRRQIDKAEGTFAQRETVEKELDAIKRLLYIGLGAVAAIEVLLRFIKVG